MAPANLIAVSAAIGLLLGIAHLVLTFFTSMLRPRDPELEARMKAVSPVITTQTTMWKAWIGFNASHGFGAIGFGSVYGYLALVHPALLLGSGFLAGVGGLLLFGYVILARNYWFSVPFRGALIAFILYAAGFAATLA